MRALISQLMLTVDEAWLNYAERIHLSTELTPHDILLETTLFEVEALLRAAQLQLPPEIRRPATNAPTLEKRAVVRTDGPGNQRRGISPLRTSEATSGYPRSPRATQQLARK
jgi:hypothetical protein